MARYFFDVHDGDKFTKDAEGLEFETDEYARQEAARALADLADDALPDGTERDMAVEVRDANGEPLFSTNLRYEVRSLRPPS